MKIRFSDVYTKTFEPIVDRSRVMATIKAPDKRSHHDLGDRRYELAVKQHRGQGDLVYYVWVLATVENDDHVLRVFVDVLRERLIGLEDGVVEGDMLRSHMRAYNTTRIALAHIKGPAFSHLEYLHLPYSFQVHFMRVVVYVIMIEKRRITR